MRIILLFIFFVSIYAENLIIRYPNLKKFYYRNQIINLTIKIVNPNNQELYFYLQQGEINITKKPFIYILNIKFKNNQENFLKIISEDFEKTIQLNSLYKTKEIEKIPNFCNVLADNMQILNPIATLTGNKILLSFSIKTKNGNLKDFKLNKEDNLTLINKNEATYYIYLPSNTKKFSFYYFNTKDNNFKKISIPINLKEETISTQTNLNPEEKNPFTPFRILILIVIAFLILAFIIYQNIIILIISVLLSIYLIKDLLPKGEKTLKANSPVRILPTKNSTIFYKPDEDIKVKILYTTKNYTKIEINHKIGWVKNENLK
jgi:hypothetical protein